MMSRKLAILISLVTLLIAVLTATPDFRKKIRETLLPNSRQVLATASGDFMGTGQAMVVIKVRENRQVSLEFYLKSEENLKFMQRVTLAGPFDGYFTFQGEATNLAVSNLDPDLPLEILAPSFDDEFIAHLQVIKYNNWAQKFEFMSEDDVPQVWRQ